MNCHWQRQYDANQDQFLILLVPSHVSLVSTSDRMGYFVSSCFVGTQLALSRSWFITWWRHQIETFSALLALCEGMMSSSNGNIFRVTGHLCGECTGPRMRPNAFPKAVCSYALEIFPFSYIFYWMWYSRFHTNFAVHQNRNFWL